MFPQPSHLAELAALASVRLADTPFPVLLVAHHAAGSTGLLVARRGPIEKRVVLDRGVPVDCRSNLAHETFSRFLAASGRLTVDESNASLARALARGVLLGELLVAEGRMEAAELHRLLQQSLARKLFDLFTWREGEIEFEAGAFANSAALKVKVPRLVLTGVERFVPQETIDAAIGRIAGSRLALHPYGAAHVEELRPTESERALLAALAQPRNLEELGPISGLAATELARALWGLALLGLVVPADLVAALARPPAAAPQDASPAPHPDGAPRRHEIESTFARLSQLDAYELLDLGEDADWAEIEKSYLAFARRFAPWQLDPGMAAGVVAAATELFAAGALAFARLRDPAARAALRAARRAGAPVRSAALAPPAPAPLASTAPLTPPALAPPPALASGDDADLSHPGEGLAAEPVASRATSPFRIETDLLDAELQYKKGRALKEAKRWGPALSQFAFAADCDPQNGSYRAEAAHCRYLQAPSSGGPKALEELKEAQRIDPEAITPYLYAGEIATQLGRFDEAEAALRAAARRLGPNDRRALDALRELAKKRKK